MNDFRGFVYNRLALFLSAISFDHNESPILFQALNLKEGEENSESIDTAPNDTIV